MTRFYIVAKVPVMLQYEKAAVSNSAFKGDVVYDDDVKESERVRRVSSRSISTTRDCFITIRAT